MICSVQKENEELKKEIEVLKKHIVELTGQIRDMLATAKGKGVQ